MLSTRILVSACVCAAAIALSGAAFASDIFFDADGNSLPNLELTVNPGDTFVLAVDLSGFVELTGSFQFEIAYDDTVLTLVDYDTYMGQPDEDPGLGGTIQTLAELGPWATSQWTDPVTQELNQAGGGGGGRLEFYTAGSLTETATGDGILAYLVFQAAANGATTLDLQMPGATWFLEDVTVQPTPINCTVNVIPEPSSLLLITLGFALAARRRRRHRLGQ